MYRIISQLDVASPKAKMELIALNHATATEVQRIIEQLYGSEESGQTGNQQTAFLPEHPEPRPRDRDPLESEGRRRAAAPRRTVGTEGKYIEKIISDERTNSLLVLANAEAMQAVVAKLDVDVDQTGADPRPLPRARVEDVAQVLSQLSRAAQQLEPELDAERRGATNTRNGRQTGPTRGSLGAPPAAEGGGTSAVAAFDSGLRITR